MFSLHFWLPKLVKTNQFWTVSCSAPCNLVSLSNGFEDTELKINSPVVDVVRRPWLLTILICISVLLTASRNHFVSPIVEGGDRLMAILRLTKVDMCWPRQGLCHLYSSHNGQINLISKRTGQTISLSLSIVSPGYCSSHRAGSQSSWSKLVSTGGSGVTNMAGDGWRMWQIWEEGLTRHIICQN